MTQQLPGQTTQRAVWDKILNKIRDELIVPALKDAKIDRDVTGETRFRWDALDITMSWPKDNPEHNVHAWLTGDWPTYRLNFEGAAWQDDWGKLKRRVLFFRGPVGGVRLSPPWNNPEVELIPADRLRPDVQVLVSEVSKASLADLPWEYDLKARPSEATSSRGQQP